VTCGHTRRSRTRCATLLPLLATRAEVVVAPSAIHIGLVAGKLRQDVKVAAQDIHTAKVRGHGHNSRSRCGQQAALVDHTGSTELASV
jgi:hypothetical protein